MNNEQCKSHNNYYEAHEEYGCFEHLYVTDEKVSTLNRELQLQSTFDGGHGSGISNKKIYTLLAKVEDIRLDLRQARGIIEYLRDYNFTLRDPEGYEREKSEGHDRMSKYKIEDIEE